MSGGAAENTALTSHDITTEDTAGTTITTGDDHSSAQMDDGTVWCVSGANLGQERRITSTSSTALGVTIPFDNTIAVGDLFIDIPYYYNFTTTIL